MLSSTDLRQLRLQLVADAGAALMALLVATTLSVYKPWGLTSYGRCSEVVARNLDRAATASDFWKWLWLIGFVVVVALFAILHLTGGGLHGH
jgi:amino acid transporter